MILRGTLQQQPPLLLLLRWHRSPSSFLPRCQCPGMINQGLFWDSQVKNQRSKIIAAIFFLMSVGAALASSHVGICRQVGISRRIIILLILEAALASSHVGICRQVGISRRIIILLILDIGLLLISRRIIILLILDIGLLLGFLL